MLVAASGCERWASRQWERCNRMWRLRQNLSFVIVPFGGKARIILQVLVTPSEVMDNQPMLDLLWRVRFRWKLWPWYVTGDRKYGTEENLVAIEREHIHAYIPSPDVDHRTEFFSSDCFRYEAERDIYLCPAGKELRFDRPHSTEQSRRYRARAKDCNHCPLKAQCTTSKQGRSLCRSVDEEYLDRVRAYQPTEVYKKALRKRSVWVEPLFAEGKDWHGMRRLRLRRLERVNCEALVRAAGQNLKRLLKKRGGRHRPGPTQTLFASFLAALGCFARTVCRHGLFSSRLVQMAQNSCNTRHLSIDELFMAFFNRLKSSAK